jgi:hypothetical protein
MQFKQIFPEYADKGQIESIDASVLIKDGGVLNCASWNIMRQGLSVASKMLNSRSRIL